jgi:hypothetical protein
VSIALVILGKSFLYSCPSNKAACGLLSNCIDEEHRSRLSQLRLVVVSPLQGGGLRNNTAGRNLCQIGGD